MTRLMEQAIDRLRSIPESQHDGLAQFLLNELEEDERWTASTARHAAALERQVHFILADDDGGNCTPLDPESL